jgi:hypothetical protein
MADEIFTFNCPKCNIQIEVLIKELNCRIFRCGAYKETLEPINPHASLEECNNLLKNDLIYGCTQPFKILQNMEVVTCEYTE